MALSEPTSYGYTSAFYACDTREVTTTSLILVSVSHMAVHDNTSGHLQLASDTSISITIPPFVGGDYFCESGVNSGSSTTLSR